MADTKISALTANATPAGTDQFATNQGGVSVRTTLQQVDNFVNTSPQWTGGSATAGSWPTLANGTVLSSAAANAFENDGAAFYRTVDTTSGRAFIEAAHIFRLTSDGTTRGGSIADFFADGGNNAFPTVLNAVYEIDYYVWFTKTTSGTVTWTLTNTQSYTNAVAWWRGSAAAGQGASGTIIGAGIDNSTTAALALPASASLTGTPVEHHHHIHLLAECGTAGNIRLRVTCGAGTVTPRRGSYYVARRLPAGNVGTFAA